MQTKYNKLQMVFYDWGLCSASISGLQSCSHTNGRFGVVFLFSCHSFPVRTLLVPDELLECCHKSPLYSIKKFNTYSMWNSHRIKKKATKKLKKLCNPKPTSPMCTLTPGPYHSDLFRVHWPMRSCHLHLSTNTTSRVKTELTSQYLVPRKWEVCRV